MNTKPLKKYAHRCILVEISRDPSHDRPRIFRPCRLPAKSLR